MPNSSEAQFSVKATLTGIDKVAKPIYVIAQNISNPNILCYGKFETDDSSINTINLGLIIAVAGEYNVFAVSSDSKKSTIVKYNTSSSDNTVELEFADSSSESEPESKTVVIKKIDMDNIYYESKKVEYTIDNTLNYHDDYVSFMGDGGCMFFNSIKGIASGDEWLEHSLYNNYDMCGQYAIFGDINNSNSEEVLNIGYYGSSQDSPSWSTISTEGFGSFGESSSIQRIAFTPEKYVVVDYMDNTSKRFFITGEYNSSKTYSKVVKNYKINQDGEFFPYDLKMAKKINNREEKYFLGVFASSNGNSLSIYEVSSTTSEISPLEVTLSGFDYTINEFKVLKNGKFYVETTNRDHVSFQSGLIDDSGSIVSDLTSNRSGCYVDSNGDMYRYDPSELAVVKTATLDGESIESYKFQTTTTTGEPISANINGVLGFEENADQVTIFVY